MTKGVDMNELDRVLDEEAKMDEEHLSKLNSALIEIHESLLEFCDAIGDMAIKLEGFFCMESDDEDRGKD